MEESSANSELDVILEKDPMVLLRFLDSKQGQIESWVRIKNDKMTNLKEELKATDEKEYPSPRYQDTIGEYWKLIHFAYQLHAIDKHLGTKFSEPIVSSLPPNIKQGLDYNDHPETSFRKIFEDISLKGEVKMLIVHNH